MTDRTKIKEVFTSIQGEGPFVGIKQVFIRFCGCNLDCEFCDTDHSKENSTLYTIEELIEEVSKHKECHSVALTGGEPLLHTGFLKEFLPHCPLPVYLETNATLAGELGEIIDYVDYVSADIKLPSCTGEGGFWNEHDAFLSKIKHKEVFAKIVFDENITEEEIQKSVKIGANHNIELILQPKMEKDNTNFDIEFAQRTLDRFLEKYKKVRLIPQVHRLLNLK